MPFLVQTASSAPFFLGGYFADWPPGGDDVQARAQVAGTLRNGSGPLDPQVLPRRIELRGKPKMRPMFESAGGSLVVSEPTLALFEAADPGRHQAFPIELITGRDDKVAGTWFILHVHAQQSSIIEDLSGVGPMYTHEETRAFMQIISYPPRLVLRGAALSGLNMWREARFVTLRFMSDALLATLQAHKVPVYNPIPVTLA